MKKIIILSFILFLPIFLFAQDWKVEWGKPYKKSRLMQKESFMVGQSKEYYYVSYDPEMKNDLLQFNHKHELVKAFPIGKVKFGKRKKAEKIITTKAGDFFISSSSNSFKRQDYFYATQLTNSNKKEDDPMIIFSYKTKANVLSFSAQSPDSSKVLFSIVSAGATTFSPTKFNFFFFDTNLKNQGAQEVVLPKDFDDLTIKDIGITNSGEIYILVKRPIDRTKRWIPNNQFIIFRVNEEGIYNQNELKFKDSYPVSSTIFSDNDNIIYVAGAYTEGIKNKSNYGVYIMKFGEDNELLHFKKTPFSDKVKNDLRESQMKNKWKSVTHFQIDDLVIDYKNKHFSFVGENKTYSSYTVPNRRSLIDKTTQEYTYFSGDLIIPRYTFDGELKWLFHLPKLFYSSDGHKVSSVISYQNENIFLVYNDFKSSKESEYIDHDQRKNLYSYYTDFIKINKDGDIDMEETIFHSRDLDRPFIPGFSKRLKNGSLLLNFQDKRLFQFGTLIFR